MDLCSWNLLLLVLRVYWFVCRLLLMLFFDVVEVSSYW